MGRFVGAVTESIAAGEDLTGKIGYAVAVDATLVNAADEAYGILESDGTTGEMVSVTTFGPCLVSSGAVLAKGALFSIDTSGQASADDGTNAQGMALELTTDGTDLYRCMWFGTRCLSPST